MRLGFSSDKDNARRRIFDLAVKRADKRRAERDRVPLLGPKPRSTV
jgi:hypothetical protein